MPGVHADGRRDAKITTQGIKTPGGGSGGRASRWHRNTSRGIKERETGTCAGGARAHAKERVVAPGERVVALGVLGATGACPQGGGDQCLRRKELVLALEKLWCLHREGDRKGSHSWMCTGGVMPGASIGGRQDAKGAHSRALRRPGVMLKGAETPEGTCAGTGGEDNSFAVPSPMPGTPALPPPAPPTQHGCPPQLQTGRGPHRVVGVVRGPSDPKGGHQVHLGVLGRTGREGMAEGVGVVGVRGGGECEASVGL